MPIIYFASFFFLIRVTWDMELFWIQSDQFTLLTFAGRLDFEIKKTYIMA